ncbi:phosphoribosyltransferase [Fodinicurvata halophila]|uniref:Phosphoribosyltransferase n=1 Tax=Fodinicurvata halophila TaxID=1419723 RepID=A0ABV8UGU3_9PROT
MFKDRQDAGERLAGELKDLGGESTVVLALPRGGVPIAAIVAKALGAPLGLLMVRKIGAPGHSELAVAAAVHTGESVGAEAEIEDIAASLQVVRNDELIRVLGVPESHIDAEARKAAQEIAERQALYGDHAWSGALEGRTVILIDDGVATGLSARAALQAVRRREPAQLIFAAPVAAPDVASELAQIADRLVALHQPEDLGAVSLWYENFDQVGDREVVTALAAANERSP